MPTVIAPIALSPRKIAAMAVTALHDEAELTPKPGLVDRRGSGAHTDMTLDMLHSSAEVLSTSFVECAQAAMELDVSPALRARLGVIGRAGEHEMLTVTGGVNTHRGALWSLGLLAAATGAGAATTEEAVAFAAALAKIADPAVGPAPPSHGAQVRRRYRVDGAPGEAKSGFPHVVRYALPTLRSRPQSDPTAARLDALLSLIAHLDDTCLLHRGGATAAAAVQSAARAVLGAGGTLTDEGRQRFSRLDGLCMTHRLSPGGAGDLLAVTLFLDRLDRRRPTPCRL